MFTNFLRGVAGPPPGETIHVPCAQTPRGAAQQGGSVRPGVRAKSSKTAPSSARQPSLAAVRSELANFQFDTAPAEVWRGQDSQNQEPHDPFATAPAVMVSQQTDSSSPRRSTSNLGDGSSAVVPSLPRSNSRLPRRHGSVTRFNAPAIEQTVKASSNSQIAGQPQCSTSSCDVRNDAPTPARKPCDGGGYRYMPAPAPPSFFSLERSKSAEKDVFPSLAGKEIKSLWKRASDRMRGASVERSRQAASKTRARSASIDASESQSPSRSNRSIAKQISPWWFSREMPDAPWSSVAASKDISEFFKRAPQEEGSAPTLHEDFSSAPPLNLAAVQGLAPQRTPSKETVVVCATPLCLGAVTEVARQHIPSKETPNYSRWGPERTPSKETKNSTRSGGERTHSKEEWNNNKSAQDGIPSKEYHSGNKSASERRASKEPQSNHGQGGSGKAGRRISSAHNNPVDEEDGIPSETPKSCRPRSSKPGRPRTPGPRSAKARQAHNSAPSQCDAGFDGEGLPSRVPNGSPGLRDACNFVVSAHLDLGTADTPRSPRRAARLLGLTSGFTSSDARAAYVCAAKHWHPDRPAWVQGDALDRERATAAFRRAKTAFELVRHHAQPSH